MKGLIAMVYMLVITIGGPCVPQNGSFLDATKYNYTSAAPITQDDLPIILQIYGNLSALGEYKVALQYDSLCSKKGNEVIMINSMSDVWLCFDDFYLLTCNQVWKLAIKCGTYVQIHRPFDPAPLTALNLQTVSWVTDQLGHQIINMDLSPLCAGTYHLWFIYYSRSGKFLKGVSPIFITYPSCHCKQS